MPDSTPVRALELFCGIGGFAAATEGSNVSVAAACDFDDTALAAYRLNFPGHTALKRDLQAAGAWELCRHAAGLWWLSPPCQPYCERGARRDIDDQRAASLLNIISLLERVDRSSLPPNLALENVEGFTDSRARDLLRAALTGRGYACHERMLCPTSLGIPSRRPRYYLTASLAAPPAPPPLPPTTAEPLAAYLCDTSAGHPELLLNPRHLERFAPGLRIIDPHDAAAVTTCFTSGYGKSVMAAGSYLATPWGVRLFSPGEVMLLLGFPARYRFPEPLSLKRRWSLAGNSLSVAAVREVLRSFPWFRPAAG